MIEREFNNLNNFYPFYLSQHTNSACKLLHLIGLILSLIVLSVVVVTNSWIYLPSLLLIAYGCAWVGHFFFEKNKPATFKYPLWSLLCDFKMAKDLLMGKEKF